MKNKIMILIWVTITAAAAVGYFVGRVDGRAAAWDEARRIVTR